MMLGDRISAVEAERIGMLYKVLSLETFKEEITELAEKLAKMPTKALGLTKKVLNQSLTNDLESQLALESKHQIEASESEDYREGVASFVEKRVPNFKGK